MKKPVKLTLDTVTSNTLRDIEDFMRNEHKIFVEFPDIYTEIPEKTLKSGTEHNQRHIYKAQNFLSMGNRSWQNNQ